MNILPKIKLNRIKYTLLRYLPGRIGKYYSSKYVAKQTQWNFEDAVMKTEGTIALDLGANIGEYTQILASKAKLVYAFEPDPWAIKKLKTNTAHLKNVKIIEAAAGISGGTIKLYRHQEFESNPSRNSQGSSVIPIKIKTSTENFFEVQQIDIINFIKELDLDIGILKVDIEGAEVELFEKMFLDADLLSKIRYIFAETHEQYIEGHAPKVKKLRMIAEKITKPKIDLNWH